MIHHRSLRVLAVNLGASLGLVALDAAAALATRIIPGRAAAIDAAMRRHPAGGRR